MKHWRFPIFLVLVMFAYSTMAHGPSAQTAPSTTKRAITEKDLFDFIWIARPEISPDGSQVAFTRVNVDEKKTGYETSIWTVVTSGDQAPMRMTNGKHDSGAVWSPDGHSLAFVRGGEKDDSGKPKPPQIALLSLSGGEARIITDLPKGAGNPVWSPNGKRILFSSSTTAEDIAKQERKKQSAKPGEKPATEKASDTEPEHESDIHIITRAVYQINDEGFIDPKRHSHFWVINIPKDFNDAPKPVQLTSGDFSEREPVWSPDGSQIYFASRRVYEPYYETPTTEIYSISSTGGQPQKLTTIPMGVGDLTLSHDGQHLAFHGAVTEPVRSHSQSDVWVMDIGNGKQPRNLTANYDFDMGDSVFGDNAAPRGGGGRGLYWSPDGKFLIDAVNNQGRTIVVHVDTESGKVTEITHGQQAVLDYSVTPDSRGMVALVSTPTVIGDLYTVSSSGEQHRITELNQKLWSQLNLTEPEEFDYTSFDGKKIQAWIQKPPDFDSHKKYPLILDIHGGPHAAYGWVFDHEFQWMAAKGYVVLYPNPRGSTGYGQDFGNIIQYHYPGDDYRDLMVGVDELVKRGHIDDKKLGVTGGSGGGVLTNWTVTHTNRFAAAVSQRDISDWSTWWYTADFTLFQPAWFKAPPFQDPEDYKNRSAITFVQNIHTPLLFILGEEDSRTPPEAGGEQIFRALKFMKRPTAIAMFPRESHELSRSGEPWHRIERLENIVGWFDRWMMGVPHPEFEVGPDKSTTASTD